MKGNHTHLQRQLAAEEWRSIGITTYRSNVRFGCGHLGTLGTLDRSKCSTCHMEAKLKKGA